MIICRTPFRISLFGGGTDLPDWYKNNDGMIISGSINKYCFITLRNLPEVFDFNYRLRYHATEQVSRLNDIKHGPYREILKYFRFEKKKIEIVHSADLPSLSGLGGSSSSTVCATHAISALKGYLLNKKRIAKIAIEIEQKILREYVGSQDQITAAFGGLNLIHFKKSNDFTVENLVNENKLKTLNNSSILVFTGIRRFSKNLEKKKIEAIKRRANIEVLKKINDITYEALEEFSLPKINLKNIGNLMNRYWVEKKKLNKDVTNKVIENICSIAMKNGAYGAKLLGSGAGGFVYILCPNNKKKYIYKKLNRFKIVDFAFESSGSTIIYNKF